jgi:hypothetical protein
MTAYLVKPCARVFISCGQNKDTNEASIAKEISERLLRLGFDPYIGVQEQTLRGLKENIFRQLSKSEYFIFVDFRRDRIGNTDPPEYKGSLFSHQELALASYLDIPVLALQESGVQKFDGILGFLQANAIPFNEADRHLLPSVIAAKVLELNWDPNWRNELALERSLDEFTDSHIINLDNKRGRFFHIGVQNRHLNNTATNCYAYLEKAKKLDPLTEIPLVNAVELKWEGYPLPNAHIPAGSTRRVDACRIPHDHPTQVQFLAFADASYFVPQIQNEGTYELQYMVIADNFPPARCKVELDRLCSLMGQGAVARF